MWAAATTPRTSTRQRTFVRPDTRSCGRLSRARIGGGATWTRSSSIGPAGGCAAGWRTPSDGSAPLEFRGVAGELHHPDLAALSRHRAGWGRDPFGDLTRGRIDASRGRSAEPDAGGRGAQLIDALAADESRPGLRPPSRPRRPLNA